MCSFLCRSRFFIPFLVCVLWFMGTRSGEARSDARHGACARQAGWSASARAGYPGAESDPRYARDRTFDLVHTALDLRMDLEAPSIRGTATTVLSPLFESLEIVELDAVELEIDSVRQGRPGAALYAPAEDPGEPLVFTHRDGVLRIHLAEAVEASDTISVVVSYRGSPERGLIFVQPTPYAPERPYEAWTQGEDEDSRYWFPGHDYPNDRGSSSISITTDARYTVVSNGELLGVDDLPESRERTWRFFESHPHVTYLMSVAVAEFSSQVTQWRGIPVEYYVPAEDAEKIERNLGLTPRMLDIISDYVGMDYPYAKYAQVAVSEYVFGGMENISATTLTRGAFRDEIAVQESDMEGLVSHELAHQWWGDMLTCRDWSHAWLNEGFATYFETIVHEQIHGDDRMQWDMLGNFESYAGSGYRRSMVERRYRIPMDVFDSHIYARGACVLHMLRHELGDEAFQHALRYYTATRAWTTVTTQDLVDAIEASTGRSVERFFDQWVRGQGHPELVSSWSWSEATGLVHLSVDQGETEFALTLPVAFLQSDGTLTEHRLELESHSLEAWLPSPERPVSVLVDPDGWLLAEVDESLGQDEAVERLALLVQGPRHLRARVRTVRALGELGAKPGIVAALEAALAEDPFVGVREEAAEALGKIGDEEARDALLALLEDASPRVRASAASALGGFWRDEAVAQALERTFARDAGYRPRANAVRSLAKIRGKAAKKVARRALDVDSYRDDIRRAGLDALLALDREEEAAKHARRLLVAGQTGWIRSHSAKVLGRYGDRLDRRRDRQARSALARELEELLEDRSYYVRREAAGALVALADPSTIPALERVAAHDPVHRNELDAEEAIADLRGKAGADADRRTGELSARIGDLEDERRELEDRLKSLERLVEAMESESESESEAGDESGAEEP